MENFDDTELDFEVDLDDIINDTSLDDIINDTSLDGFLNNEDLKSAIEDVGVGCNDEYERLLIEQKKKREQYLQYKEQRRRETKEERLRTVLMEKRELEALKAQEIHKEIVQRNNQPKRQKSKPMARIDRSVEFNRNTSNKRQTLNINTIIDEMGITKKIKSEPKETENKNFGSTTVLIKNLSPETNEFTIYSLCETVGKVLGVCIALEDGIRKAMARFESPVDALLFQRKYDFYKLNKTCLKTSLIP